jgi:hypothetical protein
MYNCRLEVRKRVESLQNLRVAAESALSTFSIFYILYDKIRVWSIDEHSCRSMLNSIVCIFSMRVGLSCICTSSSYTDIILSKKLSPRESLRPRLLSKFWSLLSSTSWRRTRATKILSFLQLQTTLKAQFLSAKLSACRKIATIYRFPCCRVWRIQHPTNCACVFVGF